MAEELRAKGLRPSQSRLESERGEEVGGTSSQNSAGGDVTREVPLPSWGREIVIQYLPRPGARVEHPVIADIDGNVIDADTFTGEQHQIAWLERVHINWQGMAGRRLLA